MLTSTTLFEIISSKYFFITQAMAETAQVNTLLVYLVGVFCFKAETNVV